MKTKTDAKATTATYEYDAINRLTAIKFPDNSDNITYTYDKNRIIQMTDPSGVTAYEYDRLSRITKETKTIDNITYTTGYGYDANSNLQTITYPSGKIIVYTPDAANRITTLQLNNQTIANIGYTNTGLINSITYGNGINETKAYDKNKRITNITNPVLNRNYTYDKAGNITAIIDNLNTTKTQTLAYDSLYRLTGATGPWGNLNWSYDGVGNRQTETDNANTNTYSYQTGTNKLNTIAGAVAATYTFDQNGNTATENTRQYLYNQNQRLMKAVDNGAVIGEYVYNGKGQRVKKIVTGQTTIFHYNLQGQLIAESNSAGTITAEYIYLTGQPFAKIENNNTYYYHNDHLGTPIKMTDGNGQVVWEGEFKPFGEVSITGTVTNNFRFPGQYYDEESGLHQNYHRDYNPGIGRYVESDPIGLSGEINLFVYTANRPIDLIDPQGLFKICTPWYITYTEGWKTVISSDPRWVKTGDLVQIVGISGVCYWSKKVTHWQERGRVKRRTCWDSCNPWSLDYEKIPLESEKRPREETLETDITPIRWGPSPDGVTFVKICDRNYRSLLGDLIKEKPK